MDLRKEIQWFAEQMEMRLREHDDRPGWKDCNIGWLIKRFHEEIGEFEEALWNRNNLIVVFKELADIGNFCMMIADVLRGAKIDEIEKLFEKKNLI